MGFVPLKCQNTDLIESVNNNKILFSNKLHAYFVMQTGIVLLIIVTYYVINLSVWRLCPPQKASFSLLKRFPHCGALNGLCNPYNL